MGEPLTTGGIIALIVSGGAMWIREWKKGRSSKDNNNYLKEIKEKTKKIDNIDKNVAVISTAVKSLQNHCQLTTKRFDEAINGNRKEILEMAKDRKR